jgi:hypothetical protein
MTYDELRLQQLLGPFNRPQGIATLNPLAFQYTDQFYPDLQSTDVGYSIAPPGSADEGYAIGPSGTADDLISTGFYGSPDVGFPFAPANRLGGLDLPRFEGVSELGRQDEDVEQVEYLPGQEPSGIEKLISKVSSIPGAVRSGITGVLSRFNPISMLGSFIGGGLGSLRNLNQRIQGSTFGQSQNLAEYFSKRREAKAQELASRRINDAARIQAARAVRTGSTSGKGEGRGSYTSSISRSQAAANRDAARGRR